MKTGELPTLANEFFRFHNMVYPDGTQLDQRRQLEDAFIAGAFLVLDAMTNEMGEEETIALCESWLKEAVAHTKERKREHGRKPGRK